MEYKTYVQKLPTIEAYYDKESAVYVVRKKTGDIYETSKVPKALFESSWKEVTTTEQAQLADTGYVSELT